jgi:hypothetical protein
VNVLTRFEERFVRRGKARDLRKRVAALMARVREELTEIVAIRSVDLLGGLRLSLIEAMRRPGGHGTFCACNVSSTRSCRCARA